MFIHNHEYLRGIALTLQGESMKAGAYVKHAASLGVLREKMVAGFVRGETPDIFKVETGLIRHRNETSRQCDLLVHDSSATPPYGRWGDFVIIDAQSARAVIEVKSTIDEASFDVILDMYQSVSGLCCHSGVYTPVFAYGLSGVQQDSFARYLGAAMLKNRANAAPHAVTINLPVACVIQDQHLIALRPTQIDAGDQGHCCLINFNFLDNTGSKLEEVSGLETGILLGVYRQTLKERQAGLGSRDLYAWFNSLPIRDEGKLWITQDGGIRYGSIDAPQQRRA